MVRDFFAHGSNTLIVRLIGGAAAGFAPVSLTRAAALSGRQRD